MTSQYGGQNLKPKTKLSPAMTLAQFDNGYWHTTELKAFAKSIGIPSASKLRKDELETVIKLFLATGKLKQPGRRSLAVSGAKDVERGLRLELPVVVYTNDKVTKDFLEKEAQKMAPSLRRKSGARYRLNRWREAQLVKGIKLTYRDLVAEYVRLNQTTEPFAHIPHGRYINFMSDFLAREQDATREQALKVWEKLKTLDIPKNYQAWTKFQSTQPK
jgi:SAP domain-containing new25